MILDILPPQPQELEAMNITDKSFILKWKTVTGEGSLDERSLYQVMHTFYKLHNMVYPKLILVIINFFIII